MNVWNSQYDSSECLIREVSCGAAYHSKVQAGRVVHPLRTSAFYAHGLVVQGDPKALQRAEEILERIISLQDADPWSPFFGIWSYFLEEPPAAMAPADFNWADFISIHLLEILLRPESGLPQDLLTGLENAVGHAVLSIFRRNVHAGYTNIAIMGATVCLLAGELFGENIWATYGRNRLRAVRQLFEQNEGFNEYNSPTYSLTALFELERILRLVNDEGALGDATILWRAVWKDLADSYHPATGQLSGPQSRSYGDWLNEGQLRCLEIRLRMSLPRRTQGAVPTSCLEELAAPGPIPCPEEFQERFVALSVAPLFRRQCRVRNSSGQPSQVSACWMSPLATFGSINQEICWYQTRPVLGYWRSGITGIARCRVRVLHNGKDFSSALLTSQQSGSCVLSAVQLIVGGGTYHPHFDHPSDGSFPTRDLRLRVEIEGPEIVLKDTAAGSWWAGSESGGLAISFGPAMFSGLDVQRVETSAQDGVTALDLILYSGASIDLHPSLLGETFAAVLLRWSPRSAPTPLPAVESIAKDDCRWIQWRSLNEDLSLRLARLPMERTRLVEMLQTAIP